MQIVPLLHSKESSAFSQINKSNDFLFVRSNRFAPASSTCPIESSSTAIWPRVTA
jgi:hypothetical protein